MASFDLATQAAAGIPTPSAGNVTIFVDTDKNVKSKDESGAVTNYGAAGVSLTSLTGEVSATGPGAGAAVVSNAAVIGKVLTGLVPTSGQPVATDTILQAIAKLAGRLDQSWFPTASDGDVTLSSDTTLVRDMYYNSLVINPGVTLFTAGYRIFANVSITNNGTIGRSGNNGLVNTAGAALVAGTIGAGGAGGAGGVAAGTAGGGVTTSLGGAGGAGGLGSGGAGGAAGASTVPAATVGGVEVLQSASRATLGRDVTNVVVTGGGGGGGGGGDGTAGGGGGSGGGVIVMVSRIIQGSGSIQARGGNGGTPAGGNRGGGAGAGGGVIVLVSENDTTMTSLTTDVLGGVGSSGAGTGVGGNSGANGRVYRVRV